MSSIDVENVKIHQIVESDSKEEEKAGAPGIRRAEVEEIKQEDEVEKRVAEAV